MDFEIIAKGPISKLFLDKGIGFWSEAVEFVRSLPYGRNASRERFELVLIEGKGSCSSKHALLSQLAKEQEIEEIKLIMGIYAMNEVNTPGIGDHINQLGLEFIPEAHCYLQIEGIRVDYTSPNSSMRRIKEDILYEENIQPSQAAIYKVDQHKKFVKEWIERTGLSLSFQEVWAARERCIASLTQS